jgi:hypothetical protein
MTRESINYFDKIKKVNEHRNYNNQHLKFASNDFNTDLVNKKENVCPSARSSRGQFQPNNYDSIQKLT